MEPLVSHASEPILRIWVECLLAPPFQPQSPAFGGAFFVLRGPLSPAAKTGHVLFFSKFREPIAMSRVWGWRGDLLTRVAPMIRKEYEYRRNAIVSVELARRTASPNDKARLLKLAEAWLDLAKRTRAQSGHHVRKVGEHPIAKLGDRDQRAA